MKPLFDSVTRETSLAPLLSFERVHYGVVSADPSGRIMPIPNLTRTLALQALCNTEHRAPTNDEIAGVYDFEPFRENDPRHRAAAAAVARQRAEDARRAAGQVEDAPATKTSMAYSFADIFNQIEGEAALRSRDIQPGENGVVRKFAADPAKTTILACRLAGGGVAPTADEINACLHTTPFLRTPGGDYAIPKE